MKIGLWSDAVNFPNVPLMKLSAYHKQLGDVVEFVKENGHYDKVYLSKTFNLPLIKKIPQCPPLFYADEIVKGGTGYSIKIENGKEFFDKNTHTSTFPIILKQCAPIIRYIHSIQKRTDFLQEDVVITVLFVLFQKRRKVLKASRNFKRFS